MAYDRTIDYVSVIISDEYGFEMVSNSNQEGYCIPTSCGQTPEAINFDTSIADASFVINGGGGGQGKQPYTVRNEK